MLIAQRRISLNINNLFCACFLLDLVSTAEVSSWHFYYCKLNTQTARPCILCNLFSRTHFENIFIVHYVTHLWHSLVIVYCLFHEKKLDWNNVPIRIVDLVIDETPTSQCSWDQSMEKGWYKGMLSKYSVLFLLFKQVM